MTRGLEYLHSIDVIHGDLKSVSILSPPSSSAWAKSETQANILIDPNGTPRLTDFGLSSITRNIYSANASTPHGRGSTRWKAPELLELSTKPKDQDRTKSARPTSKSDTYSLAMVAIEVIFPCLAQSLVSHSFGYLQIFTGRHPFDPHSDEQVILLLAKNSRPDKPVHGQFTSKMWSLTKKCWNKDPNKRPEIPEVLKKLESRDGAFSDVLFWLLSLAQEAYREQSLCITSGLFGRILQFSNKPSIRREGRHKPSGLIPAGRRPGRIFTF